jgi:hypothetical protein
MTVHAQEDHMTQEVDDFLAHYGVKGMRWGVRGAKPTSSQIMDARAKQASRQRAINSQIDKTNLATGKKQEAEAKKLNKMGVDYLKSPDRATAARMTTGEKFGLALLAVGIPGVGTGAAAVAAGSNVIGQKRIARQQKQLGVKRY